MVIKKLGKKGKEWIRIRPKLIKKYFEEGITRCERCGSTWILSFHHIDKRSSGKAEHTFQGTRLLCASCHQICEYDKIENEKLRRIR
jgi:ribosomal protein S27AE